MANHGRCSDPNAEFEQIARDSLVGSLGQTERQLEILRVKLLYRQSAGSQVAVLLNVAIYVYSSYGLLPTPELGCWTAAILALYAARISLQRWFTRIHAKSTEPFDPRPWERAFIAGTALAGLGWGLAGSLMLPWGHIIQQAFVGFLLAGTTAGAAVAYASSLKAARVFFLLCVLPFTVRLALEGTREHYLMAILLAIYAIVFSGLTARMNRQITESLRLRFEKDHLLRELKATQAKVTQSAKMAALGEMAGGIAHEINNPLASIRGATYLLRDAAEAGDLDPKQAVGFADEIDGTVVRIAKIISGLRSFAREGKGDPMELCPVGKIMDDTLVFCRGRFQNRSVPLSVDSVPEGLDLRCHATQISQVLLNLLNNALDAVQGRPGGFVKVEIHGHSDYVCLAVVDNGAGVPPELRDKIMQPFFTTKEIGKGTGLGLSVAKGIVESHGGTLCLDPSRAHTCFVVKLPRAVEPVGPRCGTESIHMNTILEGSAV